MQKQIAFYALFLFSLFSVVFIGCQKSIADLPKNPTEIPTTPIDSTKSTADSTTSTTDTVNKNLAVLINAAVSGITPTRATVSAEITADGGFLITEQGICYDTLPNPNITKSILKASTAKLGAFSLELRSLKPNTTYYARAYATNSAGTGYSKDVTFYIQPVKIGDHYGGGVVFYIDASTHHGLISALAGENHSATWGCSGVSVPGLKTEIGSGQANTKAIIAACNATDNAAKWCDDLINDGYKDWFLPSRDELAEMYKYRDLIGFNGAMRWSSSEISAGTASAQSFGADGSNGSVSVDKATLRGVRAIRAF